MNFFTEIFTAALDTAKSNPAALVAAAACTAIIYIAQKEGFKMSVSWGDNSSSNQSKTEDG